VDAKTQTSLRNSIKQAMKRREAGESPFDGHGSFHHWDETTRTATLYRFPNPLNPTAVVKLYDQPKLFHREYAALHDLRQTGRVCRVYADSKRDDPRYWDDDFDGEYFIVKQFYPRSLTSVLNDPNWFETLDLATQETDISRLFMDRGWRDYDARIENDAVSDAGRVIRIDLDSVLPLGAFQQTEKYNFVDARYFYIKETDLIREAVRWEKEVAKMLTPYEVRNLAIRITFLFVGRKHEKDFTNRLRRMSPAAPAPSPPAPPAPVAPAPAPPAAPPAPAEEGAADGEGPAPEPAAGDGLSRRFKAGSVKAAKRFGSYFRPREPDGAAAETAAATAAAAQTAQNTTPPQAAGPGEVSAGRDETLPDWLSLWERGNLFKVERADVSTSPEKVAYFTSGEGELLARLTHHLITEPEHGFDLLDLRSSLLMLTVAFLRDRRELISRLEQSGDSLLEEFSPNTRLYSLRGALPSLDGRGPAQRGAPAKAAPAEKPPFSATIKAAGGRAWQARGKSHCEDRTVVSPESDFGAVTFAAVVDGVTGIGGGLKAADLAEQELKKRAAQLRPATPDEASAALKTIIEALNKALLESGRQDRLLQQAMLVMAVAVVREDDCFVTVARAGDCDCVVYSPTGDVLLSTRNWGMDKERKPLGGKDQLEAQDFRIETRVLGRRGDFQPGAYRVRLYSDGVREAGHVRIRERENSEIGTLLQESEEWPARLHGGIGDDDWSVAGIDLELGAPGPPAQRVAAPAKPRSSGVSQLKVSELIDSFGDGKALLPLSETARRFWQQLLAPAGRSTPASAFILDLVGAASTPAAPAAPPFAAQPAAPPAPPAPPATPATSEEAPDKPERPDKPAAASQKPWAMSSTQGRVWYVPAQFKVVILAMLILVGGVAVMLYLMSRADQSRRTRETPAAANTATPTPSPTASSALPPQRVESQKKIEDDLSRNDFHLRDRFAQGSALDEPLKQFIDDLAAVVSEKGYVVEIEVYGVIKEPGNKEKITKERAVKLTTYLAEKHAALKGMKITGRGLPANLPQNLPIDYQGIQGASLFVRRRR
jgi:serine/threonine protein phosphatase PrpC